MVVDATGTLYIQDTGLDVVLRYREGTTMDFLPSAGTTDMALDGSGNLYLADKLGVKVVNREGKLLARLPVCPAGATGVSVSPDGRLFASVERGIFELPSSNGIEYDFGNILLGGISTGNLAVCNQFPVRPDSSTPLSLTISGANASEFSQYSRILGDSSTASCSTHSLPANAICLVTLRFSPIVTSTRTAILSIKSNNVELTIPLSGTGVL
jgi:hypothetical protein